MVTKGKGLVTVSAGCLPRHEKETPRAARYFHDIEKAGYSNERITKALAGLAQDIGNRITSQGEAVTIIADAHLMWLVNQKKE